MRARMKKAALVALCSTGAALAQADAVPPAAAADALPVCTLAPGDATKLAVEPCRPAPTQPSARRRDVAQVIQPMSRASAPARPYAYRPAIVAPTVSPAPKAPLPQNGCDAGGCRDAAGSRYNGGIGNATLGPDGKVCNRNGVWLQCF